MAKKKTAETANIKAAPVLRSDVGGDVPSEEPIITKSYSVRDDWKDKGIVNYVAFKSVDGEVQDLTVNGEAAGGGGGDLQTAQVTFINTGSGRYTLDVPSLNSEGVTECTSVVFMPEDDPHLRPTTVIIGPNGYFGTLNEFPSSASATGGVRYDEGDVYITGDGTLTIS